jgi:single-stranded-DNA-specific exonuclease
MSRDRVENSIIPLEVTLILSNPANRFIRERDIKRLLMENHPYFSGEYPELAEARASFEKFIATLSGNGPIIILCDGDVDGLGAGVVLWHLLERRGFAPERLVNLHAPKGSNAFTRTMRDKIMTLQPAALFIMDLGIAGYDIAPGVPVLLVDHHRPGGQPPGSTVITGYQWRPVPTSSLLTFLLCNGNGEVIDKAWAAAIGNLGDLGPEHPLMQQAIKEQKQKYIREATSLLNAAKRSSDPDIAIPAAFRAMQEATSARAIVEGGNEDLELLRRYKLEVQHELNEARRVAPKFSQTEKVALLRFDSPARVHPLLAQSWRGRLPKYIVMAANGGFLPGKVSFSMRTNLDINLLDFLARHGKQLEGVENEYGHGHDKATGGTLNETNFNRLMESMGFNPEKPA